MADTDVQDPAQIEAQRRSLLALQPPEPTSAQETSPDAGFPKSPPKPAQPQEKLSTDLSFAPVPQLRQYDAPLPQRDKFTSPFDVFKDPMIVLAGLSSLFTRRPLIGAMNYAAGAMKGFHEGQQATFDQNKVKFDEALKATMEQNRTELLKYNAAWDRRKEFNWQKTAPELLAQASASNDQLMIAAIHSGNWDLVEKIMVGRETAQNRLQSAVDAADAKEQAREREVDRLKQDPGVIAQAKAIQDYDQPMPPLSRNNPRNQAINELVTEQSAASGESYETPNYAAKNKFITGLGSTTPGSPGGQATSMNTIVGHLNTLDRLIDDLKGDSNTVAFRRAAQAVQIEFGLSSAPTNFDVAREMIGGEIVKLVVGAGGTGEDREKTRQAFDRANSTPLLHDAVRVTREIIGSRVGSLVNTAKGLHADKTLMKVLKPETIKALEGESATPRRKVDREAAKKAGYSDAEIDKYEAGGQ